MDMTEGVVTPTQVVVDSDEGPVDRHSFNLNSVGRPCVQR